MAREFDAARERFVTNVAGHILGGVKPETLPGVLEYWKSVDADTGKQIEELVHAGTPDDGPAPAPTERRGVLEETPRSHAG